MSDLVKRLRGMRCFGSEHFSMLYEAANEIQRLRHEIVVMTHGIEVENSELREQLATVTRERDEQKERNAIMKSNMVILEDELREQLAACQRDAERYCWLRDQMSEQQYRWFIEETPQENWDTAIDKAIAAMKEQRT